MSLGVGFCFAIETPTQVFSQEKAKGKIQHFFQDFVHTIEIKHTMLFMPKILAPSTSSF